MAASDVGSKNRSAELAAPLATSVPPGVRLYVIGDIHGSVRPLRGVHESIRRDRAAAEACDQIYVVYIGDYVDRGLDSREVIDCLLSEPISDVESIYLKGNHEQQLLWFLDDPMSGVEWMRTGGDATLYSYGVRTQVETDHAEKLTRLRDDLADALPDDHLAFLSNLRLSWQCGDYMFVHAGLDPGKPLDDQDENDLLWIRDDFLSRDDPFEKFVIHGHSVTEHPDVHGNRIGIDTGAYLTNILTCLVLEGATYRFLAGPSWPAPEPRNVNPRTQCLSEPS